MPVPILYSFRRCPYAMRARMAIAYANSDNSETLAVELREVWLKQKPRELLSISPKGTVPVLLLPDGEVLEESIEIMNWALGQSDPFEIGRPQQDEISRSLLEQNDGEFKLWLDRYKYADRHPEYQVDYSRGQAELFLKKLEGMLGTNKYLIRDSLSAIDLAIFPFVRQFAMVDMPWFERCEYGLLRRWLFALLDSEKFQSIMKKYAVWDSAASPILFPETGVA